MSILKYIHNMPKDIILEKNFETENYRKKTEWRTIGVRIRNSELPILNRTTR